MQGTHMSAAAAGGCMRGSRVSRDRCTSCTWLHSFILRSWPGLHGPPTCLISGPTTPHAKLASIMILTVKTIDDGTRW